jgi:hypothetical protein
MSYFTSKATAQVTTDADKANRDSIKDAGRVHVGGGFIQFDKPSVSRDSVKDKGRVHVGGGFMRF